MMKRAIVVLITGVVILTVLAAATVQIILWTDWPRQIVESALRDATGLEIRIDQLSTGWTGSTTARGITVALPLEDQPFLEVPVVEVSHVHLLRLAFTRSLDLNEVTVRNPLISMRQNQRGDWNLVHALEVIRGARGASTGNGSAPALPRVTVDDTVVDVMFNDGRTRRYDDIDLTGDAQGQFGWSFEVTQGKRLNTRGALMLRTPFHHEFNFEAKDLQPLLGPWLPETEVPLPQRIAGSWSGRFADGDLAGQLRLVDAVAGEHELTGVVDVRASADNQIATITPISMTATSPRLGGTPVRIESGSIHVDAQRITVDRLLASGHGARACFDGNWSFSQRQGRVAATWSGIGDDAMVPWLNEHQGTLEATIAAPRVGPITVDSRLTFDLAAPPGTLKGAVVASASSPGLDSGNITGRVRFPSLSWEDDTGTVNADGLAFEADIEWPMLRMKRLHVPGPASASGTGEIDLDTNEWAMRFEARSWQVPRTIEQAIDLNFDARGDFERIEFTRFHVANDQIDLRASGRIVPSNEEPVAATAQLEIDRPFNLKNESSDDGTIDSDFASRLASELNVHGSIEPLELVYEGQLTLYEVRMGERMMDEVTMPWNGSVNDSHTAFRGETVALLGGRWRLRGELEYSPLLLKTHVIGADVPLNELLATTQVPMQVGGILRTEVELRMPELDATQLELVGDWEVADLSTNRLSAGRGSGRIHVRDQMLYLHDIRLEQDEGWLEGEASFNLGNQQELDLDLAASAWPVVIEGTDARALIGGNGRFVLDVIEQSARGDLLVDASLYLDDQPIGQLEIDAAVDDHDIHLDRLHATVLDGEISAHGSVTIGDWLAARLDGKWSNVDVSRLAVHVPEIDRLRGISSGRFSISQAKDPRALGPARIEISGETINGAFGEKAEVGDFMLLAFAGPERIILDRGSIDFAGGRLDLWGRSSMHGPRRYVHGQVKLVGLDLDQTLHAVRPDLPNTPGQLDGQLTMGTYAGEIDRTFGTGKLYLSKSDLGALPAFDLLYNLLRLDFQGGSPTGYGLAEVRVEGTTLEIQRMEYFNRGTDVAGSMTVSDYTRGGDSPIDGAAVGAVRPFRDLDLPLVGDLDRLIAALQSDAVAISITGTLADRKVQKVELAEIGTTLRRILAPGGSGN